MKPEFLVRAFVVSQELSWQPLHKGHALYTEVHPPVGKAEMGVVPSLRTTLFLYSRPTLLSVLKSFLPDSPECSLVLQLKYSPQSHSRSYLGVRVSSELGLALL